MKKLIVCLHIFIFIFLITGCTGDEGGVIPDTPPEVKPGGEGQGQQGQAASSVKGGVIDVNLGGPNEPNSVYIDLSTGKAKEVRRDRWELGFYNGTENRVFLNASLLVTAAKTELTDIDKVTRKSNLKKPLTIRVIKDMLTLKEKTITLTTIEQLIKGLCLGYQMYGDVKKGIIFTDNKEGTLEGTAIGKIAADPSQAKVCIVSAGSQIPTTKPGPGAIATTKKDEPGGDRGFYKIKVFMKGNQYVIQYAKLDEKTHKEFTITKDKDYNLIHFSLLTGKTVKAAPPKTDFDINFAGVFSYYGIEQYHLSPQKYEVGVTYSDYALTNHLGGTGVYVVFHKKYDEDTREYKEDSSVPIFEDFKKADVDESKFVYNERSVIDSHWRYPKYFHASVELIPGIYYIIKDVKGNIYKLKFTAYLSKSGERGYPQFTYKLLK